MAKHYINPHLYKILQMIIEDYNLPIKRISADRIDIEGRIMRYDTPHAILRYTQKTSTRRSTWNTTNTEMLQET